MKDLKKFKKFLDNKKVIIVGPSESSLTNTKEFIESYDVICRIKKSFPVDSALEEYIGSRTNILLSHLKVNNKKKEYKQNNFNNHHPDIFNKNLDYILFPYPLYNHFNRFYNNYKKDFPKIKTPVIYKTEIKSLLNIQKELNNYCPTILLAGIIYLLEFNISELFITGITFQQDGFLESYKNKKETRHCQERTKKIHNMDQEIKYFKNLIKKDKRIKIDDTLENLLNSYDLS